MSVTKLACEECGAQIGQPATGRRRHTCSNACRQRSYRQRVSALGGPNGSGEKPFRLTAETREALRRAIDRRRRELLAERPAVDRELFADEAVTA